MIRRGTYVGILTLVAGGCVPLIAAQASPQQGQQTPSKTTPQTQETPGQKSARSSETSSVLDRSMKIVVDTPASAETVIRAVEKQIGVRIWMRRDLLGKIPRVTNLEETTVRAFFEQMLRGTNLQLVAVDGGELAITERGKAGARPRDSTGTIRGKISDVKHGNSVGGANVTLAGTSHRTMSDSSGAFQLRNVPGGSYTLSVQSLGYAPQRLRVTLSAGQDTSIVVSVDQTTAMLSEVVTTATGARERVEVANDVVTIDVPSVIANRPVPDVTTLLETRVPGLTIQRSSGQPGSQSRYLTRGVHSGRASNDPIIILDGIRVRYDQSNQEQYVSPIDQIDVNAIETIEVLKGPSAASLYGTDAANGVIIITSKRGKVGPPRWSFNFGTSQEKLPGKYPSNYVLWGTGPQGNVTNCRWGMCDAIDSVSAFQWVNFPGASPFGTGTATRYNASVTGGNTGITYSVTLGQSEQLGMVKMPGILVERYQQQAMGRPLPESQRRPDRLGQQNGTATINIHLTENTDVNVTSAIARSTRHTSGLNGAVSALTALDPMSLNELMAVDIVPRAKQQITARTFSSRNGATANWRPLTWFSMNATGGLDLSTNDGQDLLRRGDCPGSTLTCGPDSTGVFRLDHSTTMTSSANVGATVSLPINSLWTARVATGVQVTGSRLSGYTSTARDLVVGDNSLGTAGNVQSRNLGHRTATGGVYVEGALSAANLLYMTVGVRRDAGTSIGSQVAPTYPKWGISALPPESWMRHVQPWISSLRVRTAFGHAGVQPGPADKYRTYLQTSRFVDGKGAPVLSIEGPGNDRLRPERGVEIEWGPDIGFWNERLVVGFTAYRRTQRDAVYRQNIAPSLGAGGFRYDNIGTVLNTGRELTANIRAFDSPLFSWQLMANASWTRNRLTSLNSWIMDPALKRSLGLPLGSLWGFQVLGYADKNDDGMISRDEVLIGDEYVYMGAPYPKYTAGLHSNVTLINRIHVGMTFSSEHGVTQQNSADVGVNNPFLPFDLQAQAIANVIRYQTVSSFRFNALSVGYDLPPDWLRTLRMNSANVAIQGSNLGLRTNYLGKDPNVNSSPIGMQLNDNGAIPQPRTWTLTVRLGL